MWKMPLSVHVKTGGCTYIACALRPTQAPTPHIYIETLACPSRQSVAMSARERFKRFKGQLRKGLRGNTGAAPAQSAPSLPNAPLPSTSLASAPPAVSPAVAGGSWTGLAHFQNVLTTGLGVFGPLRLVIDDLARCISVHEVSLLQASMRYWLNNLYVQDAAAARHDYQVLKAELEALFSTLSIYFDCDMPPTMTASIDNICRRVHLAK